MKSAGNGGTIITGRFPTRDQESGLLEEIDAPTISTDYAGIGGAFIVYTDPNDATGCLIVHRGAWTAIYSRDDDRLYLEVATKDLPMTLEAITDFVRFAYRVSTCSGHWFGQRFSLPACTDGQPDCPDEQDFVG